jgi:PAS domain S-box-containing protein
MFRGQSENGALRLKREARVQFEVLISDLSARFVRATCQSVDPEIDLALGRVMEFFRADRCGLLGVRQDRRHVSVTHAFYAEGLERVPLDLNLAELHSWAYEMLVTRAQPILFADPEETPPEAERDRRTWTETGVRSSMLLPIFVGDCVRHIMVVQTLREKRQWPEEFIPRLRLLGEIFVSALERGTAERELREREELLGLAAESAGAGFWLLSLDNGRLWTSQKADEIHELAGEADADLATLLGTVHPADRDQVETLITEASRAGGGYETEYRIVLSDGSMRWVSDRARVMIGQDGRPAQVAALTLDITERKQAEADLAELRQELARASRTTALGEMAAAIAHELNQPLGAILSNTEAAEIRMREEPPPLGELRAILTDIRADGQRAGQVIQQMRALLRGRKIEPRALEISSLLDGAVQHALPLMHSARIKHRIDVAPGLPPVRGDEIHIQQVLLNLLLNAKEAMDGCLEHGRSVLMSAAPIGPGEVEIAVSDTGAGFAPGILRRPFQPFSTTKSEGMGMGMAICRTIVQAHGGEITLENNPSGGATVRFTLPVAGDGTAGAG